MFGDNVPTLSAGRWWKKDEVLHVVVELKGEKRTEFELEGDTHLGAGGQLCSCRLKRCFSGEVERFSFLMHLPFVTSSYFI